MKAMRLPSGEKLGLASDWPPVNGSGSPSGNAAIMICEWVVIDSLSILERAKATRVPSGERVGSETAVSS